MQSQKYFSIIPKQERIQDLAQGGGTNRKIFCPPPWAPQGGTGGDCPEIALSKDFAPFIKWVYKKISRKKSLSPPWITQGGTFWLSPPWIAQAGDNSQGGGQSPPWNCSGGDSPLVPPPVSALVYTYTYTRAGTGGGNRGLSPHWAISGGGLSPPWGLSPAWAIQGGDRKNVHPLSDSGRGQRFFSIFSCKLIL